MMAQPIIKTAYTAIKLEKTTFKMIQTQFSDNFFTSGSIYKHAPHLWIPTKELLSRMKEKLKCKYKGNILTRQWRLSKYFLELFSSRKWRRYPVSFWTELSWLFWRSILLLKHAYKNALLPFVAYFMVFCIISIPYYDIIQANQEGVQNMIGFLNIFITQVLYSSLSSVVNVVPNEMPIFIQETTDGVYSPLAFYLSKTCFMSISMGFQGIIFMIFSFTVTGLNRTLIDYLLAAIPTLLLSFTACAYGFFLSTAFKSIDTYCLFAVPFEMVCLLLTGLQLKLDYLYTYGMRRMMTATGSGKSEGKNSLPWYSAWLKYLSFPYYAYESVNIIQWVKYNHIYCERSNLDQCHLTGDDVLYSLGFSRNHLQMDFIGLISWMLVWHSFAFAFFRYKIQLFAAY